LEFIMAELVTNTDLQNALESVRRDIDTLALRLTVRTGAMIIAIIAGIQRLLTSWRRASVDARLRLKLRRPNKCQGSSDIERICGQA
jgi:hypothetical protein